MTLCKRLFACVFLSSTVLAALPTSAITFLAARSLPADHAKLDDSVARAIEPPQGMSEGDLVELVAAVRSPTANLSLADIGGQAWSAENQLLVNGQAHIRVFHSRFNGQWSATPSVETDSKTGAGLTLAMLVFRPSHPSNQWGIAVPQASAWFGSPAAPLDVTTLRQSSAAARTVTVAAFITPEDSDWSLQTEGWSNVPGLAALTNAQGGAMTLSMAYRLDAAPGVRGPLVNRQTASGEHDGRWVMEAFEEEVMTATKKWHPGHYIWTGAVASSSSDVSDAAIHEIAAMPNIQGMKHSVYWRTLEPSRGVYDFSRIDHYLSLLKPAGKRLIIEFQDRTFGGGVGASVALPGYLAKEPGAGGGWFTKVDSGGASHGVVSKFWLPAVMDRYIALWQAFAERYDSEPALEAVTNDESSPGFQPGVMPADWSRPATAAQLNRLTDAWAQMFQRTVAMQKINNLVGEMSGLVDHCYERGIALGGPDVLPPPHSDTSGSRIMRGISTDGAVYAPFDYRGSVPFIFEVQGPEMGGKEGDFSFKELYDHAHNVLKATHVAWLRKTWDWNASFARTGIMWNSRAMGGRQDGHPGIKSLLEVGGLPLTMACPAQFRGACDTD